MIVVSLGQPQKLGEEAGRKGYLAGATLSKLGRFRQLSGLLLGSFLAFYLGRVFVPDLTDRTFLEMFKGGNLILLTAAITFAYRRIRRKAGAFTLEIPPGPGPSGAIVKTVPDLLVWRSALLVGYFLSSALVPPIVGIVAASAPLSYAASTATPRLRLLKLFATALSLWLLLFGAGVLGLHSVGDLTVRTLVYLLLGTVLGGQAGDWLQIVTTRLGLDKASGEEPSLSMRARAETRVGPYVSPAFQ